MRLRRFSIRSPELLTLLPFAAIVSGILFFFVFAGVVVNGELRRLDEALLLFFRRPENLDQPIGPSWLLNSVIDITALGGGTVLTMITVGTTAGLLLQKRAFVGMILASAISLASFLQSFLKEFYGIPRPSVVPHLDIVSTASFPSGHSMMSAVVYLTLGAVLAQMVKDRKFQIFIVCTAILLSLLVGMSRIYLGVHYPSDVVAGWAIGSVWSIATGFLLKRVRLYEGAQ